MQDEQIVDLYWKRSEEAIRETAKERNRPKREIYNIYHQDVEK